MALSIRKGFDPFTTVPSPEVDDGIPKRIPVMVIKAKGAEWEYLYGHIVTHLDVKDYCDMHGLTLVEVFRGTRAALRTEQTELF
jgi:hypothetical protein